jgi:hypothetical protein
MLNINKRTKKWVYTEKPIDTSVSNIPCVVPKICSNSVKRLDFDLWYNEYSRKIDMIVSALVESITDTAYCDNDKHVQFVVSDKNELENVLVNWIYVNSYNSVK